MRHPSNPQHLKGREFGCRRAGRGNNLRLGVSSMEMKRIRVRGIEMLANVWYKLLIYTTGSRLDREKTIERIN